MSKTNANINAIVVGAGRLGANIAKILSRQGNDVLLVDRNKDKLANVMDYSGFAEVGDATDLSFMEDNGIKEVDRIVLATENDNTNIYLADVCSYIYGIKRIHIRLKDSRKIKIIDSRVKAICPFDLSLDDFEEQLKGEKE